MDFWTDFAQLGLEMCMGGKEQVFRYWTKLGGGGHMLNQGGGGGDGAPRPLIQKINLKAELNCYVERVKVATKSLTSETPSKQFVFPTLVHSTFKLHHELKRILG